MSVSEKESMESMKVTAVGFFGWLTALKLADVATIVSIGVGLATLGYVLSKTYFLFKNHGKSSD